MKKALLLLMAILLIGATTTKKHAHVARMWRGRVPNARADEYQKYLDESGIQKLRKIKDNLGAQMFRRGLGDGTTEFVVISYWPNRDSRVRRRGYREGARPAARQRVSDRQRKTRAALRHHLG